MQKALVFLQAIGIYAAGSAFYYNYQLFKVDEMATQWHTTYFSSYFAPNLIYGDLAFLLSGLILLKKIFKFNNLTKIEYIDFLGVCLAVGATFALLFSIFSYFYFFDDYFTAPSAYSKEMLWRNWGMHVSSIATKMLIPLLFFRENIRRNVKWAFFISFFINFDIYLLKTVVYTTLIFRDYF